MAELGAPGRFGARCEVGDAAEEERAPGAPRVRKWLGGRSCGPELIRPHPPGSSLASRRCCLEDPSLFAGSQRSPSRLGRWRGGFCPGRGGGSAPAWCAGCAALVSTHCPGVTLGFIHPKRTAELGRDPALRLWRDVMKENPKKLTRAMQHPMDGGSRAKAGDGEGGWMRLSPRLDFGTWVRAVVWGRGGTQGGDARVTLCHVLEGEAAARKRKGKSAGWCFPICRDGDIGRFCWVSLGLCRDPQRPPHPRRGLWGCAWPGRCWFCPFSPFFDSKPKRGVLLPGRP